MHLMIRLWLSVNISKLGHLYSKILVDGCFLVKAIDKQSDAIVRLQRTVQNVTKEAKSISTTMNSIGVYLH